MVKIFTGTHCPHCHSAKEFFKENNIEFEERNINEDKEAKKELLRMKVLSVPVIVINDEVIIGFQRDKVAELLGV